MACPSDETPPLANRTDEAVKAIQDLDEHGTSVAVMTSSGFHNVIYRGQTSFRDFFASVLNLHAQDGISIADYMKYQLVVGVVPNDTRSDRTDGFDPLMKLVPYIAHEPFYALQKIQGHWHISTSFGSYQLDGDVDDFITRNNCVVHHSVDDEASGSEHEVGGSDGGSTMPPVDAISEVATTTVAEDNAEPEDEPANNSITLQYGNAQIVEITLSGVKTLGQFRGKCQSATNVNGNDFRFFIDGAEVYAKNAVHIKSVGIKAGMTITAILRGQGGVKKGTKQLSKTINVTKKTMMMSSHKDELVALHAKNLQADVGALLQAESMKMQTLHAVMSDAGKGAKVALRQMVESVPNDVLEDLLKLDASRPADKLDEMNVKLLKHFIPKLFAVEEDVKTAKATAMAIVRVILSDTLMSANGSISWKDMERVVDTTKEVRANASSSSTSPVVVSVPSLFGGGAVAKSSAVPVSHALFGGTGYTSNESTPAPPMPDTDGDTRMG